MSLNSDEVIAWLHGYIVAKMRDLPQCPRPHREHLDHIVEMVLNAKRSEKNYVVGLNLNTPQSST